MILSVGRVSAHNLLGCSEPVGKLIRQSHQLPGTDIPLKVTYHPGLFAAQPVGQGDCVAGHEALHQMLQ